MPWRGQLEVGESVSASYGEGLGVSKWQLVSQRLHKRAGEGRSLATRRDADVARVTS